jgi:hypothetical protein
LQSGSSGTVADLKARAGVSVFGIQSAIGNRQSAIFPSPLYIPKNADILPVHRLSRSIAVSPPLNGFEPDVARCVVSALTGISSASAVGPLVRTFAKGHPLSFSELLLAEPILRAVVSEG